jgi:hypothetical protein
MKDLILRILAVFAENALKIIGAGAIVGIDAWKSAVLAGISGVADVVIKIMRAYYDDGKITMSEVNEIFSAKSEESEKTETP